MDAAILPPIGCSVELHFSLPVLPDAERKMHVQCMGETLRLEGTEQGKHTGGSAMKSREVVWHYEGGNEECLED